jgi:beta-aspartyl-dipeptidase (metallo-type)
MESKLTLIENGDVYAPEPRGRQSVLLAHERILQVGAIDRAVEAFARAAGLELDVVDATRCVVTPGAHRPARAPPRGKRREGLRHADAEITLSEIVTAGITTVVGCLGVDTTMKTMPGLLAKAKALREEGLHAFVWSGGYDVPPTTVLKTVRDDIMFIDEVIGAGETAIADRRSVDPNAHELAKVITDAYVGGMLSRKAGVTHFHVGDGPKRLLRLREALEADDLDPAWLYVTHINRSEELLVEAVELVRRGATADIDTTEGDAPKWVRLWLDRGGDPERLTVSSDASITGPGRVLDTVRSLVAEHGFPLERALPFVTTNTARVLRLPEQGRLAPGLSGDVLVLRRDGLELRDVFARGRAMVRDGRLQSANDSSRAAIGG